MGEHHDTVIVGAGQAGLAMSAVLQRYGREHVVLERRRVGERWRAERWDSLRFQFPNWSLRLPGWRYQGADPGGSLDLARERIGTIIWATGYAYDLGWVKAPVLDAAGRPLQRRGITRTSGLYFLGLHWMHTIKSGLLSGVGNDAEYLAEHIAAHIDPNPRFR